MVKKYNQSVPHSFEKEALHIEDALFSSMWELFVQIGVYWKNAKSLKMADNPAIEDSFKSQLMDFMNNRIQEDPTYYSEYQNARTVIAELTEDYGEEKAYERLFTAPVNPKTPPKTPFERARIKVSNEFILFQLAVGGFKAFGAKNYLGYFGGANIEGHTPYRTPKQ